jgi:hypothetical protein
MFGLRWLGGGRYKASNALPVDRPVLPTARPVVGGFESLFGARAPAEVALKGTVVVVGNCLAETIGRSLQKVPAASSRYSFVVVPLHLRGLADPDVQQSLSTASHVLMQGIAVQQGDLIRSNVPSDCTITTYPDLVLRSLWPFDAHSGHRDPAVDASPNSHFRHHDGALAKLRDIEPDRKKRLLRYMNLDFEWASGIDRVIAAQRLFFEAIDKQTDAYLGRFISRHFRSRQLFYDSVHPSAPVFQGIPPPKAA